MTIYKVRKGGSIKTAPRSPNKKTFVGGEVIPAGVLSKGEIEEHVKSGFLQVIRGRQTHDDAPPPGHEPLPGIGEDGKPAKVASLWAFDPDGLRARSLDTLNVMVMERDEKIDAFDTVDEAIGWLSQDYEGE